MATSEYVLPVGVTQVTSEFVVQCVVDERNVLEADFLVHGKYPTVQNDKA